MSQINYKMKYQELKLRFMNSVDMSFRLGYEQGIKDSQVDQLNQAQQSQEDSENAQMQSQGQSQPGEGGDQPDQDGEQEQNPASAHPGGSELDQHITKLEGMLGKSELSGPSLEDLKKSLAGLKSYKMSIDMKKAEKTINAIGKNMKAHRAFKLASKSAHNLPSHHKQALVDQEKIVSDIMKAWDNESKKAAHGIANILNIEGLSKKE